MVIKHFHVYFRILLFIALVIFLLIGFQYFSRATYQKANIRINSKKIVGRIPQNWKALAQGGEESGVRMLENVIPQISSLNPIYIRIDHIYDFYDVVSRDQNNNLILNWEKLDATICDIYRTGAKPFFSLGYMPPIISLDNSLISPPKNWDEWTFLVQKTIERYSGKSTRLCGQITGDWLTNIYYEVWNEPDLESFGKWSIYGGQKDYKQLYYYSVLGAGRAENVYNFNIGGPTTTAIYKNWIQNFLNYIIDNNLRLDFLSWHHYSKNPDDFSSDLIKLNEWLIPDKYTRFRFVPKIISEWAYDSNPNPISETNIGAAHTITTIRNLIEQNLALAFAFEIKDGTAPRWGILTHEGIKKPRYNALKFLNLLSDKRLKVEGEGTYVRSFASYSQNTITAIFVNYDQDNRNTEFVPVTFTDLIPGNYSMTIQYLYGEPSIITNIAVVNGELIRKILMPPNMVIALQLKKE